MTFKAKDDGYRPEILKVDIEAASADEKKRIYDPASEQIWELTATEAHDDEAAVVLQTGL
jgi:hypothetical protein